MTNRTDTFFVNLKINGKEVKLQLGIEDDKEMLLRKLAKIYPECQQKDQIFERIR
jgi:hypothetical protein